MFVDLPYTLEVNGEERTINCDFRDVILLCNAFNDPNLSTNEKTLIMLNNLYVDNWMEFGNVEEAIRKASWFIDWGKEYKEPENAPKLMDWEQDYNLIISAVNNKVNVIDVRELDFMHWWTFLGYFSDRGECQFSSITDLREKIAKGKKLDSWEKEVLRENRDQIILKNKANEEFEKEIFGGE